MKNIEELLNQFGASIPEEKKKEFEKEFNANYKTIAENEKLREKLEASQKDNEALKETISKTEQDLKDLKGKSETVEELEKKIENMEKQNKEDREKAEAEKKKADYESVIKEKAKGLEFTSESAKRAFIKDAIEKNFTIDEDSEGNKTILGFNDFVSQYKKDDAGAFKEDTDVSFSNKGEKVDTSEEKAKELPTVW